MVFISTLLMTDFPFQIYDKNSDPFPGEAARLALHVLHGSTEREVGRWRAMHCQALCKM